MTPPVTERWLEANRIRLRFFEAGSGPAVVFCHGFPEMALSWRHQVEAVAEAGYRAIALDMRGHGASDRPQDLAAYAVTQTVGDVIALLDHLGIDRAVMVGHDAGTTTAYHAALMRPDRIRGVMGLSVPYLPRGHLSLTEAFAGKAPPGFYMGYFQEPGVAERDLEHDVDATLRRLFYANSGENPQAPIMMCADDRGLVATLAAPEGPMEFMPEAILEQYVASWRRTGFSGALNGYRVFDLNWELTAPWAGMPLPVPSAFVGGSADIVLSFPGFLEAATAMGKSTLIDGAGHWIQAERPAEVNAALLRFIENLSPEENS